MKRIIFDLMEINILKDYAKGVGVKKWGKSVKELTYTIIMDDIKSFKYDANNGMKWTADEKASFEKLSHLDKKKYLINKMGFKGGVIFPNLSPDTLYKYTEIRDNTSKTNYEKGMNALSSLKVSFGEIEENKQNEILYNFRIASNKGALKASKELAELLCERNFLHSNKDSLKELQEASRLYQKLANAGSPDGYYGYYKLYRFILDDSKVFHNSITEQDLNLNQEQALKYLNLALEKGNKEALEDLAYDFEKSYKIYSMALDFMITVGYLYQDRSAFIKAMNYANYETNLFVYELFYTACMRMAIMLGGSLDELIMCYNLSVSVHADKIRAEKLKTYAQNRKLVDGLDPYFDELFPPDLVLDFGTQFYGDMYGGSGRYPGVYKWIEDGKMKDPRDKDSTLATVKDFYQKLWQIIIWKTAYRINYKQEITEKYFTVDAYTMHLLYRKYASGFTSARPYIFPKEVLDMKIDFNKIPPENLV
ncbi:MAG: hypothetical protein MSA07_02980 [Mucispirillum sp.]|nr:hypothetical protein [Mucispirillum sp.]